MMSEVEQELMIAELDRIILAAVPSVHKVPKYGGTLYTLKPDEKEGQFCGVFPYKDHVQLSFANGTSMDDPNGVLEGTGKYRRHINFAQAQDIDEVIVSALVRASAKLSS